MRSGKGVLWEIALTCTDRNQHKRIRLTTVRWTELPDGSVNRAMTHALDHFSPPLSTSEPGDVSSRESYLFTCPKCRRNPKRNGNDWWAAMESARSVGLTEIDLSLLSF